MDVVRLLENRTPPTLALSGRIDSKNAADTEATIASFSGESSQ